MKWHYGMEAGLHVRRYEMHGMAYISLRSIYFLTSSSGLGGYTINYINYNNWSLEAILDFLYNGLWLESFDYAY